MGGSCDGDCNTCNPEDFCVDVEYKQQEINTQNDIIKKLQSDNKRLKRRFKMEQELRIELATIIEDTRFTLMTQINDYYPENLLAAVVRIEKELRFEDDPEPDFTVYDDGEGYDQR